MNRQRAFNRSQSGLQQTFKFIERSGRHERWFKLHIIGATVLALGYQIFMRWVADNPERVQRAPAGGSPSTT